MGLSSSDVLVGTAILVVLRLILSKRGLRASLRSSFIAAVIGAVAYPTLVYASTGFAAARNFPNKHGLPNLEFGLSTFGHASPADSIPRGVMMGVLAMACIDLIRRRANRKPA